MKVLVEEKFQYEGKTYNAGDTADLPEETAYDAINKGYAQKPPEDLREPPELDSDPTQIQGNNGSSNRRITIPVKTGGRGWIDVTLFRGDPKAKKDFKKSSQVKLQVKTINDNNEVENKGESYYLSPSRAISIAPVLMHLGIWGKLHDREIQQQGGSN